MVLYRLVAGHVPITTNSNIKPYVPSNRLTGEKAYTPRICVSKSLNGCLTSIGPAAIGTAAILHELCGTSSLCPEEQAQILDRLAFPYTILTFDIPADAPYLIQASQLENEVADAGVTKECWLTKTCRPSSVLHQWFIDGTIEILQCNDGGFWKVNNIIKGDLLDVHVGIICHQVNCCHVMGAGLAADIRRKYPRHYADFMSRVPHLGGLCITQVNWNLYVVGIYGQLKYGHDGPYTNYIALQRGMQAVAKMAEEKHLPVYLPYGIGCGLAGGDWAVVKELIYRSLPKAIIIQKQ